MIDIAGAVSKIVLSVSTDLFVKRKKYLRSHLVSRFGRLVLLLNIITSSLWRVLTQT